MASNIQGKSGEPTETSKGGDIKIIVAGEDCCGKSKFIEAFAARFANNLEVIQNEDFLLCAARVYKCQYEIDSVPRNLKIYEILGGPNELISLLKKPFDRNGMIFIYAINNPFSFEEISEIWIPYLVDNGCWGKEPSVLVGNKKDLREDQKVIERLASMRQAPITHQQGEKLKHFGEFKEFFETSAIDENDPSIKAAFDIILRFGLEN